MVVGDVKGILGVERSWIMINGDIGERFNGKLERHGTLCDNLVVLNARKICVIRDLYQSSWTFNRRALIAISRRRKRFLLAIK